MGLTTIKASMINKLQQAFSPQMLEVIDESERHRGHAGYRVGGETHFRVKIVSTAFTGMPRVAVHRAVHNCIQSELDNGIHALAIEASAQTKE
nr:BolA family protein [Pseudovibrio stylochi]